jgi:hypothetical protein
MSTLKAVVVGMALALLRCASAPALVVAKAPKPSIHLYVNGTMASRQGAVFGQAGPGSPFAIQPIVIWDDPTGLEGCPEYRVEYILMGEVQVASTHVAECADPRHDSFEAKGVRVGGGVWVVRATVKTARREYVQVMEVQVW